MQRTRQACDEAFRQELNLSVFRSRFAELIGVSERELLPWDNGSCCLGEVELKTAAAER